MTYKELKKYLKTNRAYKHWFKDGKRSIWITLIEDKEVIPSISIDDIEKLGKNKEAIEAFCEFKKHFVEAKIKSHTFYEENKIE